ncbi:hypothetical protein RSOLAG22IIIB_12805 [Rhizoctonia solani]|uniref:Uncharacterized protein n=1 Tax=Rhizoctonia solani TaxID=456999 RepID=A0A0K6GGJ4_9AGAM|nr:hypothetical protein RSOLAG22IIIB_12805 [Rhizoctonia solani]
MSDASALFDQHHCVRPDLIPASRSVMKYAGYFLKFQPDSGGAIFNWFWFLRDLLDNRCGSKSDATIEEHGKEHIEQHELNINSMVDKIMDILFKFSKATIRSGDKDAITAKVKNTFTNLSRQESSNICFFGCLPAIWHESHGTNSSYTYRIGFSFPHEWSVTDFYAVIATIELKAEVRRSSVELIWPLGLGVPGLTTSDFFADITCIKLKCTKNFVAGEKPLLT